MNGTAAANQRYGWPNIALPTLGGKQFWADRFLHAGWRIQENVYTGHVRLLDPRNIRRCWGDYASCRAAFEQARARLDIGSNGEHLVLLVHGLGRSRSSFAGMRRSLSAAGYDVAAIAWPSTRRSLAENADKLQELMENLDGVQRVSFVTHSLGGLLVRELLSRPSPWRNRIDVNGVVMIAPPNQGSAMADVLQYMPPVNLFLWRGLLDARSKRATALPAPDAPFGVIAAGRGKKGFNPFLKGDDDLIVRVNETRLDGAADWIKLRGLHAFVMNDPLVVRATMTFLETGAFAPPS